MMKKASIVLLLLAGCTSATQQPASAPAPASPIAAKTAGFEKKDGFIPIYLDNKTGKILLEVPRDSMRVLMFTNLATGLGSNPIGLRRLRYYSTALSRSTPLQSG